jgi:hypothetical protein
VGSGRRRNNEKQVDFQSTDSDTLEFILKAGGAFERSLRAKHAPRRSEGARDLVHAEGALKKVI